MSNQMKPIRDLFELLTQNMSNADIKKAHLLSMISAEIIKQRAHLGMTQKQLADHLGVSQGMISKWENGDYNFTIGTLTDVLCELDVDFDITFREKEGESSLRYFFDAPAGRNSIKSAFKPSGESEEYLGVG